MPHEINLVIECMELSLILLVHTEIWQEKKIHSYNKYNNCMKIKGINNENKISLKISVYKQNLSVKLSL